MNYKPYLSGAISGIVTAATIDFHAFKSQPVDFFKSFSWKVAAPRYAAGAFFGVLTVLGLGSGA
jgi:hypothetical protein